MSLAQYDGVLGHYVSSEGVPFHIQEVDPHMIGQRQLEACATAITDILRASWRAKLVPNPLSEADLRAKLPNPEVQASRIANKDKGVRYLVAVEGQHLAMQPADVTAFVRVEMYRPRRPTLHNIWRRPYPNITDLETRTGRIGYGPYVVESAALASHALEHIVPGSKASAYTERPNKDGLAFYKRYGFTEDQRIAPEAITEQIGSAALEYVHMVAGDVRVPQRLLEGALFAYKEMKIA
jgi:hypothetical protein